MEPFGKWLFVKMSYLQCFQWWSMYTTLSFWETWRYGELPLEKLCLHKTTRWLFSLKQKTTRHRSFFSGHEQGIFKVFDSHCTPTKHNPASANQTWKLRQLKFGRFFLEKVQDISQWPFGKLTIAMGNQPWMKMYSYISPVKNLVIFQR